jgi:hypothetical protein
MRDRLVELMLDDNIFDKQECNLCAKDDYCERCGAECIADHLIENGAIVPPCKVGDIVLWNNGLEIQKKKVKGFSYINNGLGLRYVFDDFSPIINHEAIVGIVTKSEAEQKLKGMRGE